MTPRELFYSLTGTGHWLLGLKIRTRLRLVTRTCADCRYRERVFCSRLLPKDLGDPLLPVSRAYVSCRGIFHEQQPGPITFFRPWDIGILALVLGAVVVLVGVGVIPS